MSTILWLTGVLAALWLSTACSSGVNCAAGSTTACRRGRKGSALANMLLGVEEIYRPSRRHVIELRMEEAVRRNEDDDWSRSG